MDINWLRDLLEIDKQGSFSRAARERNVSVSSLSRRIQLLEEWAGCALVDRSTHPVGLTAGGAQLLPVARGIVRDIDRARDRLRRAGVSRMPVSFLAPNAVSVAVFPRLLAVLQAALGALPISLVPDNFRQVMRRFRDGDADFALFYACDAFAPREMPADLESVLIAHDALLPVARDAAAMAARERPGLVRAALLDDASYLGQVAREAMARHGVACEASVTGTQILAIRQLALDGAGLAWLPASLVAEDLQAGRLRRMLDGVAPIPITVHAARAPWSGGGARAQVWAEIARLAEPERVLHFEKPFLQIAKG